MNTKSKKNNQSPPIGQERGPVILLFGPTGVGKTDLIESLFSEGYEIINADSIQMYRGFDIGSAKVSPEVQLRIPHHLIDSLDPREDFTVAQFVHTVDRLIPEIYGRKRVPLISGGTGFYVKNFLCGLPETPSVNPATRERLQRLLEEQGAEALYTWLQAVDPPTAQRLPLTDSYRIMRALEVYEDTGRPLSSYKVPHTIREHLDPLVICLTRPVEELRERIALRVDIMFQEGVEAEVSTLAKQYGSQVPPMRGIGYREFFQGFSSSKEIEDAIITNSRRYAKRQMTFFRKIPEVQMVEAPHVAAVKALVEEYLSRF